MLHGSTFFYGTRIYLLNVIGIEFGTEHPETDRHRRGRECFRRNELVLAAAAAERIGSMKYRHRIADKALEDNSNCDDVAIGSELYAERLFVGRGDWDGRGGDL